MKKQLVLLLAILLLCGCSQKAEKLPLASVESQLVVTQKDGTRMPSFAYVGDSLAIAAVCRWFDEEAARHASYGDVWIPSFVILKETDRDGEHLVFGNFRSAGYRLEGDTMVQGGGGEMPACFHMKATENGYAVVSVEKAGDGERYAESIKAFTRGDMGLYDEFMKHQDHG